MEKLWKGDGEFESLDDMNNFALLKHVENTCQVRKVIIDNVENFSAEMMKRFI